MPSADAVNNGFTGIGLAYGLRAARAPRDTQAGSSIDMILPCARSSAIFAPSAIISSSVGQIGYVTVEPVDPSDEEAWHRIGRVVEAFGDVGHLKKDIIAYLYQIGRVEEICRADRQRNVIEYE
ncbi:hypothetical protein ELI38_00465 [Rhizobium leguminosarum]|uniref:hypothetical protein n=1 Tax=Rhizobium leguminosarum TaxID=384 RepID=UPI0010303DA3|nr:hypothetical protein [Rhizobium leguminosarum]TAU94577.1 hypothetical protein ELI38_00465 [Rhizobium leguminosarum]TAV09105.1 hypothetical protein ELI37_00465 [Rhizobium leguminosarum]TAW49953.1 hypothetical protein ELI14_00465 [Rhizobium leguminosarum]TAX48825.1 hypothetical protein ELH99_00545 [Rhizobium leguminosarum]TAZ59830.1 hypothetical protein ELH75_00545 [Rhizobium leguminosarum]